MDQKQKNKLYIAIISVLLIVLIGVTYAYFVDTVKGNDTSVKNVVKSGNIELTLNATNIMSKDNFIPGDTISTTFTVKNTGTNQTSYMVYFSKLYNTFINDDILYTLTCTASSGSCDSTAQLPLGTDYEQSIIQNTIDVGITHTYTLVITYLERSSEQDYNKGNMFGFTIKVNETQAPMVGTLKGTGGSFSYTGEYYAYKASITSITFEDEINIPNDAISSWDVSTDSTSKVMAYIKSDGVSGYNLYIQSDYKIYAPINSSRLIYSFSKLTEINNIELLDTSNATSMFAMFSDCSSLTALDVSSFNTSKVTNMRGMFSGCSKLTTMNISTLDTSKVTDIGSMFYGCSSITSINFGSINTSNVTDISSMFNGCVGLTALDLSSFNTSNVITMAGLFSGCINLTSIDLSSFNTSNATNMSSMFTNCSKLITIDLGTFDTSNVINMGWMFLGCSSLTTVNLSTFDTSKVTNMSSMFRNCYALVALNLSTFDTSKVTDVSYMFSSCSSLATLNLHSASFTGVTVYTNMLSYIKYGVAITVKDENAQTFINARLTDAGHTGTVTIG